MKYIQKTLMETPVREMAAGKSPRRILPRLSPRSLSDLELIELLISPSGTDAASPLLASQVLALVDRGNPSFEEIASIHGIGGARSRVICAALELGRRKGEILKKQIISPSDFYPLIRHYAQRQQEQFLCGVLNGAHEVLSISVVSLGTVNRTLVHPREVFALAIEQRASAVIVAHNHPSGNLQPSEDDLDVTRRLKKAGELLGIALLDHLVFSDEQYYSFLEHRLL